MKNNLKTKVMLAVLAGGMLCANGAWAVDWNGKAGGFVNDVPNPEVLTGLDLTIDDSTTVGGKTIGQLTDTVYIHGGYSLGSSNVTDNSITFNTSAATTIKVSIYGGCSVIGNASNNTVVIKNGTFTKDANEFYGGYSYSGDATGNKLNIENGTFTMNANVFYGGYSNNGNASNNTVVIKNGNFTNGSYICGGCSFNVGAATGNIVTIEGGTFTDGFILYGGEADSVSSDNILNLKTKITKTDGLNSMANNVGCFQIMNFTLPSGIANGETMLKTGVLVVDLSGSGTATVNVDAADGVKLSTGDVITLIDVSTIVMGDYVAGDILGGAADFYFEGAEGGEDKNVDGDKNDLVIVLKQDFEQKSGDDTATIKAVAEGIAASLAFVNQGADMVATSGIDGLYVADSENPTIAAFSGNKTRYNTGSHVDIHGWNALAGVALNNKASFSHGVFVEIGNGDIDTYAALNGSGSSDYKGGGYMLRKDMGKGWSVDGSVRAGRVETSWGNDTKGGYEAKQTYYGAHVNFNKMLKEYNAGKLNGYLRYTFTHLGSDSVNLDGTHYGFDSVNSHRTRLGARMVEEGQNGFELYYGAAWEYGFGGDCDANVNGVTTSGPAVDGSNAVFEVGGTWSDKKWDISAGLEGYAGAKRGVAGGMNFIYKF